METEDTLKSEHDDVNLNEDFEDALEAPSDDVRREMRTSRELECQMDWLQKTASPEACVGALNAGLVTITNEFEQRITKALSQNPGSLETVAPVLPALDAHLRVARQIDRFAL